MANSIAKGKSIDIYAYLTVHQTMKYGDIPYFEQSIFEDEEGSPRIEIMLPGSLNQEREVIKKDLFTQLSNEAKEVINIIFNSPNEILETFKTPKYNLVSRKKILDHLISNGWNPKCIKKVFKELKIFVMNLETT